jgi:hypothetical protein
MARYGALAGAAAAAAAAAIGVLCSYEARVLHFHSSPGDAFKISISEVLGCKEGCCATPNPKTEMMKAGCGSTDTTMDPILLRHFSLLQDIEALSQMLFHSCRGGEWESHYFLSEAATT